LEWFWHVPQDEIEAAGTILVRAANMLKWLDCSEVRNGRTIPSAKFLEAIDTLSFCQWRLMLMIADQAGWGDLVCGIGYLDCPNVFCWKPTGGPVKPWEVEPEERMFPLGTLGTSVEFPLHAVHRYVGTSDTREFRLHEVADTTEWEMCPECGGSGSRTEMRRHGHPMDDDDDDDDDDDGDSAS
jgi:hypothetical protein